MSLLDFGIAPGILGMNRRNGCYTLVHNPRRLYPLVDNKLKTKDLLEAHRIPAPELYFTISGTAELKALRELKYLKEFVVKPARGAEGRGILVIVDRRGQDWCKANGEIISREDLEYHVANVLSGLYSLGGIDDKAFIEYRVHSHAVFRPVTYQGVPDVRVILYRGVPVMSMLRLPTKESGGRANLHQGAVGAGVDMAKGITMGGVHHDRLIDIHPDTKTPVAGLKIPYWEEILEISARLFDVFQLGYIGVDFVIDHILGALVLELNARPGLNIQLANREGLLPRLNAIDAWGDAVEKCSPAARLDIFRKVILPKESA